MARSGEDLLELEEAEEGETRKHKSKHTTFSNNLPKLAPEYDLGGFTLERVSQIIAIYCSLCVIVSGIVGLVSTVPGKFQWSPTITNINHAWAMMYYCIGLIIFGTMGILGEGKFPVFLRHFGIWPTYWMRAVWYAILGCFVIGMAGLLGIISALQLWILSIFLGILHFLVHDVGFRDKSLAPDTFIR
eukprot:TRINITY_DN2956_c0_g1_i1.p1 TRINITY_DN2956_c0_g1~~TRINITY_DN2956_c0_g1_i1.p1  ORF type:complete len:188 (-),score=16.47 TRINITY_DN2956_c0_g1_i1:41-604(-)